MEDYGPTDNILLSLNVHGLSINLRGSCSSQVVDFVRQYFKAFECVSSISANVEIELGHTAPPKGALLIFKTRMFRVFQKGWLRICNYDADHWLSLRKSKNGVSAFISGTDEAPMIEMIVILLLSQIGEGLDKLGLHRLHAVGFVTGKTAIVIPSPSYGGKSCMAFEILKNTDFALLSDESVLLDKRLNAYAFPIPIALRDSYAQTLPDPERQTPVFKRRGLEPKYLFSIPSRRIAPKPAPADFYCGMGMWSSFHCAWSLLWGLGNAQMVELMLRPDNFIVLLQIFLKRLRVSLILVWRLVFIRGRFAGDHSTHTQTGHRSHSPSAAGPKGYLWKQLES